MRVRWFYPAVLLLLVLLSGCQGDAIMYEWETQRRDVYLGRFIISLPNSAEEGGRRWQIRHINIIEHDWLKEPPAEGNRWFFWEQHMKELENIPIRAVNKEQPKPTIEVIEPNEEGLWYKQSLYYNHGKNIQRLKWDVFADMGDHGVWFNLDKGEKVKDVMGRILTVVREAYTPYETDVAPTPYEPYVFYMEKGAVHLPFDNNERSWSTFQDDELDYSLHINIFTKKASGEVSLIEDRKWAQELTLSDESINLDILRSGQREVAGLAGEEILLLIQEFKNGIEEKSILYEFHYSGEFETANKPSIRMELKSSADNIKEKIALWDSILNSIRYVGE